MITDATNERLRLAGDLFDSLVPRRMLPRLVEPVHFGATDEGKGGDTNVLPGVGVQNPLRF